MFLILSFSMKMRMEWFGMIELIELSIQTMLILNMKNGDVWIN